MIILNKDIFKQNFKLKEGIAIMVMASFVLLVLIISNLLSLRHYDPIVIASKLRPGIPATSKNLESYVRFAALIIIVSNTLVIGFFTGLVWWGMNKRKFGWFFGAFWGFVFLVNAISSPFYVVSINWSQIVVAILHGFLAAMMLIWVGNLLVLRSRIKQEMARRKI